MPSASALRAQIRALVADYCALAHVPAAFDSASPRVRYSGMVYDQHEVQAAVDASLEFWLTLAHHARLFEARFAATVETRFALMTNSGSSANLLAVAALCDLDLPGHLVPGDEVITVAASFPTTVNPLVQHGLVPVFTDVDLATGNIDTGLMEAALSSRTRAIALAHTLGNPWDVNAVVALANRHGLWIIEDNCDALGAHVTIIDVSGLHVRRPTGSIGHISTHSFFPAHHITTGEGGMVCTDNPDLRRILASLRDWGRDCACVPGQEAACGWRFQVPADRRGELPVDFDHRYVYARRGYNLKPLEIQAAIGLAQLDKLPDFVTARNANWLTIDTALRPFEDLLHLPATTPRTEPSWFGYLIGVRPTAPFTRADLVRYLEAAGVQTRMLFAGDLTRQPAYQDVAYRKVGDLPNTDRILHDFFFIGVYPGLTAEHMDYLTRTLTTFLDRQRTEGLL